jgi:hypothetical protein
VDIARNQAQRDIDISRSNSRESPSALRELEKFKSLTVQLADNNKELKVQVSGCSGCQIVSTLLCCD